MKGHSEHRANLWRPEEVYRTCVQSLEGRCSRRSKLIHEQKIAIKEFISKVEIILLNELGRSLEAVNEPDRRLIARINRALTNIDLKDDRHPIYHVPSPSRPAWKTWNLDQEDPKKMQEVIETASELLQLPREELIYDDEELTLKDKSEWNSRLAAETIAASIGAKIQIESASLYSRATTPDRRFDVERRRGNSVDSLRRPMPLNVNQIHSSHVENIGHFHRDRPSVMSFREKSIPTDEASSTNFDSVGSPVLSSLSYDSKPGSAMSSIPMLPDQSFGSATTSNSQAVTPTPFMNGKIIEEDCGSQRKFGKNFLTRPISVVAYNTRTRKDELAVTDSCGGIYITTPEGQIKEHILVKNSSASSIAIDEKNDLMYASIMQSKGRSVHVFNMADNFKKIDIITCPKEPKIEMSRTRWLTVGPRGHLFMTTGDNFKSGLWVYIQSKKAWKTLKESRKTRYQYISVAEDQQEFKAVVLLTCDAANNRLLLFVIDESLSLINEYDLTKTYRLSDYITSPASAIVDSKNNLLVLDYATGKLWILLGRVRGDRKMNQIYLDEPINPQEALGICVRGEDVMVACFNSREVRITQYLENGKFRPAPLTDNSSSLGKRSASLPRTSENSNL